MSYDRYRDHVRRGNLSPERYKLPRASYGRFLALLILATTGALLIVGSVIVLAHLDA